MLVCHRFTSQPAKAQCNYGHHRKIFSSKFKLVLCLGEYCHAPTPTWVQSMEPGVFHQAESSTRCTCFHSSQRNVELKFNQVIYGHPAPRCLTSDSSLTVMLPDSHGQNIPELCPLYSNLNRLCCFTLYLLPHGPEIAPCLNCGFKRGQ